MAEKDELLILHLSDLHFGNKCRYSDLLKMAGAGADERTLRRQNDAAKELGRQFFSAVKKVLKDDLEIDRKIDLVIVSGDIAEAGLPSEFRLGQFFLTALAGEIGLPATQFVFVPGNHDISWAKCRSVDVEIAGEELDPASRRSEIDARKLLVYDEFLRSFYGDELKNLADRRSLACRGWVHDFPELKLSVAALNSCEKESHDKGDHVGHVSVDQAHSLLGVWTEHAYDKLLKVVVVHHNPIVTTTANITGWRSWLQDN